MNRRKQFSLLFFLLAAAWMGVIFFLSAQNGNESGEVSGQVVRVLLRILRADEQAWEKTGELARFHSAVRTLAHFSEYAVLGILLAPAWKLSGARAFPLFAQVTASVWAVLDEWHQAYVPGRACQWQDMLTDSLGAAVGIALTALVILMIERRRKHAAESDGQTE